MDNACENLTPEAGSIWRSKLCPKKTTRVFSVGPKPGRTQDIVTFSSLWDESKKSHLHLDRFFQVYEPSFTGTGKLQAISSHLFRQHSKSARIKGLQWELSLTDVDELLIRAGGSCEVTGVKFCESTKLNDSPKRPYCQSIDRIDSRIGYTKKNCRIVCVAANLAMNQWGEQVLHELCKSMIKYGKLS